MSLVPVVSKEPQINCDTVQYLCCTHRIHFFLPFCRRLQVNIETSQSAVNACQSFSQTNNIVAAYVLDYGLQGLSAFAWSNIPYSHCLLPFLTMNNLLNPPFIKLQNQLCTL